MASRVKSAFLLLLTVAGVTEATIGPVATLNIANKDISPDGFTRACVGTVANMAHIDNRGH